VNDAIAADSFSFSYAGSGEWQLSAVDLRIRRGERVAVMGATGAGKSTLAMALNGLVPHHHEGQVDGRLVVDGLSTTEHEVPELVRHVGLVMQDPETQITGATVLDDAAVGPANFGLPRATVFDRARRALAQVGMADLEDRDAGRLSGGQKQRLVVAGVLAMESDVLVLDEPTSELDPVGTAEVFEVVREVSADGDATVVLIEHEPELVAEWADRLVVLVEGRVAYDGSPAGFFADLDLVERAGIRAPQVAEAGHLLARAGRFDGRIPATLEEAVRVFERWPGGPVPDEIGAPAREHGGPVIEAAGLGHVYPGGVAALSGVDVTIHAGEFVAVLGRNGAGKTTFARHLNGLLRPTSGTLRIAGEDASGRSVSDLARSVGYVFQNPDHQIFANSVRDEVAYGLRNLGWEPDAIGERVTAVLDQVGMTALADRHPFTLGKGERQRLAVASVLALSPQILVIDEPTTGQDRRGAAAMMDLVRMLNDEGRTILMITHDMTLVAEHSERALVFASGELIADTTPDQLFGDAELLARGTLRAPQITTLAAELGCPRVVTTLPAFAREWGVEEAANAH
jgi:energy-coupling factor transporter ATP-binding protein EcfA2